MANERRSFNGGAVATTLSSGISSSDHTLVIASATNWPDGSGGDFFIVCDRGNAGEEKMRVQTRSGTTLTIRSSPEGRGADGTSAASHLTGAAVECCHTALDDDEANNAVVNTIGKVTTAGDLIVASGAAAFSRLAKGTNGQVLRMAAGSVGWAQVTSAEIATDAVTSVGLADNAVDTNAIANTAVTTGKIANAAVTETQLATSVAGAGLTGGGGTALAVNTDNSTVEIATDTLRVKAAGITSSQLAAGIPLGFLGYAESSASDQTAIGNGSYVDLTGVSVAVTAGTNRKLKITVFGAPGIGTVATDVRLAVRESTTVLGQPAYMNSFNGNPAEFTLIAVAYVAAPSAGSHTYKASVQFGGNSDNYMDNSFIKSWILVEDIGGT